MGWIPYAVFSAVALATLLALPSLAMAGGGASVAELEKQMEEMTKAFNAQIQAMQKEISNLKSADQDTQKALTDVKSAIAFHIETFGEQVLEGEVPVLEAFVAEAGVAI